MLLERSFAIKCPNVAYHLAGSKKIQQVLSEDGVLEKLVLLIRFVAKEEAELIRSTFVKMYPLDDSEQGRKAIELGLSKPERFVLKPQREGGGFECLTRK